MFDNNENEYVIEGECHVPNLRRQKELLLDDRIDTPTPASGFEIVYGGSTNSAGGLDSPRVVVFSSRASFEEANPNWAELLEDARNRQEFPYTILGAVYLYDRPEGGYEIYPLTGI